MFRIYVEGQYFYIEHDDYDLPRQDLKHKVVVYLLDEASSLYRIKSPLIGVIDVLVANLIDEELVAYSVSGFERFFQNNTGPNTIDDYDPGTINIGTDWVNCAVVGIAYAICGIRLNPANIGEFLEITGGSVMGNTNDDMLVGVAKNPAIAGVVNWVDVPGRNVQQFIGDVAGTNIVTIVDDVESFYVPQNSTAPLQTDTLVHDDFYILYAIPLSANLDVFGSINFKS